MSMTSAAGEQVLPDQSSLWTEQAAAEPAAVMTYVPPASRQMENSVTFFGPMTFPMHYRAARAFIACSRLGWAAYGLFVGVPLLVFVAMLVQHVDLVRPVAAGIPGWLALLLGPLASLAFSPLLCVISVGRFRMKNPSAFGQRRFTIGLEGFESRGDDFFHWIEWNGVDRVIESRDFFLFYSGAATAHFIPKSFIASETDLEAVRAIIGDLLGTRAKLQHG